MLNKILVAIDYSDFSRHVLDQAIALAKKVGSQITLLHVLTSRDSGYPDNSIFTPFDFIPAESKRYTEIMQRYDQQWQEYMDRNLKMLQSFAREVEAQGVEVDYDQRFGEPGSTICDVAQDLSVDTIVLGRRGHRGVSELFLGSTSNYVLHHAPCSVWIIQKRFDAPDFEMAAQKTVTVS